MCRGVTECRSSVYDDLDALSGTTDIDLQRAALGLC